MTCEIPAKGNFLTLQIGKNPVLVIRGAEGQVHAFHNVCRHRGSRLCVSEKGKVAKLVCPYHQWTYELDGRLLFAGTEMGADFDMKEYGLKPIQVKTAGGYIFISLAENPPAIDDFLATLEHYMEPYDMENAKVAVQTTIREAANWKLVIENNRECYHCNGSHPELLKTLLEWDDVTDPRASQAFKDQVAACTSAWDAEKIPYAHASFGLRNRIVRMPLLDGTVSMTMDGKQGSKKLMGRIKNPDLGSMRILHLPHSWNHCMGDHLIVFTVWPISAQETLVTTKWLVHKRRGGRRRLRRGAPARGMGRDQRPGSSAGRGEPARDQLRRLPAWSILEDLRVRCDQFPRLVQRAHAEQPWRGVRPRAQGGRQLSRTRRPGGRRCGGKVMDNLLFYVSSAFVSLLLAWNLFACWRRQRPPEKSRP